MNFPTSEDYELVVSKLRSLIKPSIPLMTKTNDRIDVGGEENGIFAIYMYATTKIHAFILVKNLLTNRVEFVDYSETEFTPRNVIKKIVELVLDTYPNKKETEQLILINNICTILNSSLERFENPLDTKTKIVYVNDTQYHASFKVDKYMDLTSASVIKEILHNTKQS